MSQLICQDLALGYAGKAIVRNLNFRINAGDYFCIVGETVPVNHAVRTLLHLQPPVSGSTLQATALRRMRLAIFLSRPLCRGIFPHP